LRGQVNKKLGTWALWMSGAAGNPTCPLSNHYLEVCDDLAITPFKETSADRKKE